MKGVVNMNTEKIAFDIIALAGDAKAELQAALKLAHQGKFAEAQAIREEKTRKQRRPKKSKKESE